MNRSHTVWLVALTVVAAGLRLWRLGTAPPGLNQDEAINAWNAWCLLKTGHDMTHQAWPVFYSHAIGDNRTTLFFYLLMPVQALFGLSAWSARLPAAVLGAACVPLVAYIAHQWFGARAALLAAALLAFDPWHLFLSRIALEGAITPFLALAPLALLTAAGLLPGDAPRARTVPALAAGLVAGIACYGYWSIRLWVPLWLVLAALAAGPSLARRRMPGLVPAFAAFAAGLVVTLGPLAWRHVTDPEIAHRAEMTRLWAPGTSPLTIAALVAQRWLIHFGPGFLWQHGDSYALLAPARGGALALYALPLMLAGLVAAVVGFRGSAAARGLLALVVAYPAGDLIAAYDGVHMLRSAAGIGALTLLAALGGEALYRLLERRARAWALAGASVFALGAGGIAIANLTAHFRDLDTRAPVYLGFHTDLLKASEWLRPRLKPGDTVFCTLTGMNEPWSVMLVGLKWEPARWFAEPREAESLRGWDVYSRIGPLRFPYDPSVRRELVEMQADGKPEHVWFIVRPGELGLKTPAHVESVPDGPPTLWVCEAML